MNLLNGSYRFMARALESAKNYGNSKARRKIAHGPTLLLASPMPAPSHYAAQVEEGVYMLLSERSRC